MKLDTEELQKIIEKIKSYNIPIIVEGIKDKKALEKLGLTNISTLKKPLYAVVEAIAKKYTECIILTDLDPKGKQLYGRLSKDLQKHGVKINNKLRNFLIKNTSVSHIEGLATFLNNQGIHN